MKWAAMGACPRPSNRFLNLSLVKNNCGQSGCKLQYRAIVFCLRKGIESTRPMAIISQNGGNR
jgi:hypothetical protein